jgi:hypothetical protein
MVAFGDLNMVFTNGSTSYADSDIWITLQRGQNPASVPDAANTPDATYGGNAFVWNTYTNVVGSGTQVGNLFADSVRLSDILAGGGIQWVGNAPSAAIYVSYGTNLPVSKYSISGISPSAPPDPSYNIAYQNFEITYNGGLGDQGDITAINFFSASLGIQSYASTNVTGPVLQSAGFHNPTATIGAQLAALTGSSPLAVLTNSGGQVTRVLGPTQYGAGQPNANDFGPYQDFSDYFASVAALATNKTIISNVSAYNTTSDPAGSTSTYTNAQVQFVLNTNSVTSPSTNGYRLESAGSIQVVTTPLVWTGSNHIAGATTTNTYADVKLLVDPTGIDGMQPTLTNIASAYVYFGDASPGLDYIGVDGVGWASFTNAINGYVDGGGNSAEAVLNAQILGELSAAFAAGFIGSTNTLAEFGSTPLGELPSAAWWNMTNVVAFSDVQDATNFFNTFADVIYQNSSNSVYGMVYSDRFIHNTTLVNTTTYEGTNVGSWLVTIGDPLSAIPEPAAAVLVIMGFIGFAFSRTFRKRRKLLGS